MSPYDVLQRLEPEAAERQLDRVEAMVYATASATGRSIDGSAPPPLNVVGSSGGFALPAVTLDMLVRAVHGGAAAAARLATPEGCAAAAQLVAQLEAAAASSPEVFHRAVSSVASRDELPSRRRVKLHRAMLQVLPHALLPQMAARGDAESARLLVACLDSPAGVYAVGRDASWNCSKRLTRVA